MEGAQRMLHRWVTVTGLICLGLFVFTLWQPKKLPGTMNHLPVYPGAELQSLMTLDLPAGATAELWAEAAPNAVYAFYRESMISDGWSVILERSAFLALLKNNMCLMIDVGLLPDGNTKIILTTAETRNI